MKIGQNTIHDVVPLTGPVEEDVLEQAQLPKKEKRKGEVVLRFTELPPNAKAEECVLAETFPYMKFPFKYFNPMQSEFLPQVAKDNNVVICGRTSAGKTIVAETVAAYTLQELRKTIPDVKVAYISPLKALASEKQTDWTSPGHDFYQYNISILTGDYILTDERKLELAEADIICMSSEMLGSRIRRNKTEKNLFLDKIRVLVVDEAHLLGQGPERGPAEEVALMKFTLVNPKCRIIFLSATMPNVEELGQWLTKLNGKPTTIIRSNYRPVELNWNFEPFRTIMYTDKSGSLRLSYKATESNKIMKAVEVIQRYPNDKFICFVHGKKTGRAILEILGEKGIAARFHNADLSKEVRNEIETSFRSRDKDSLRVVVATSTLAWGCFRSDTKVVLSDGTYAPISKITPRKKVTSFGRGGLILDDNILLNGKKEIEDVHARKIRVSNGEEVVCSDNHPILTAKNGNMVYAPANELNKDDWVACLCDIPVHTKKSDKTPTRKDTARARLFGMLFGDGCIYLAGKHADGAKKYAIDICAGNKQKEMLTRISKEFTILECTEPPTLKTNGIDGVWHIVSKKRSFVKQFLPHIESLPKSGMHIPKFIVRNNLLLREYVRWLMYCNGGISRHGKGVAVSIEFSSTDFSLIHELRHALLRFSVYSILSKKKTAGNQGQIKRLDGTLHTITSKKDSYILRIYGDSIETFYNKIGFPVGTYKDTILTNVMKERTEIKNSTTSRFRYSRDTIPITSYIYKYQMEKGLTTTEMTEFMDLSMVGRGLRNPTRKTLFLMQQKAGTTSELSDWLTPCIRWEHVVENSQCPGGIFHDLSVEKNNTYTANTIIVHNCNFPARRVIITGLHRGINLVDPLDITQAGGRAGRVGLDKFGDVHVLIRDRFKQQDTDFCTIIQPIVSKIADISALAFHLVSEISEGTVKNIKEAVAWYLRSLAHHQGVLEQKGSNWETADELVKDVVTRLIKCGAVKEENEALLCTPIGKVASWFYFSPFDVADWANNFKRILKTRNPSDHELAWAIASTFSNKQDYPIDLTGSAIEFTTSMPIELKADILGGVEKHAYAIYCLLRGKEQSEIEPEVGNLATGYRIDSERIAQTLDVLGSFGHLFNNLPGQDALLEVPYRIRYGLNTGMELLVLPGVGRKTAMQVMGRGVTTCKELLAAQQSNLPVFAEPKWEKIKDYVVQVARLGHIEYLKRLRKRKKEMN